jgi:pyruvate formate lyase activating enzyme
MADADLSVNSGVVFNVQRYSTKDGPGIRTTVFLKGCPLDCLWCHNPEGRSASAVLTFQSERCIHCGACAKCCPSGEPLLPGDANCRACGACADACPAEARTISGRSMTVGEVMADIVRDRLFYDQSGGGVTFSGGEPTAQPQFLEALLMECRREGINTAIDTCGYVGKAALIGLADRADLILYDLKGFCATRHRTNTGVDSTPILENLDELSRLHHSIWLRLPIVPGYTDDLSEMEALASRYCSLKSIVRVCLLPYHAMGDAKLKKLGKYSKLPNISAPSSQLLDTIKEIWMRYGHDTRIGV